MNVRGTTIFDLETRFKKRRKKPVKTLSAHFDSGMPIDIRYNAGFYAFPAAPATSMSAARYRVESFEDEDSDGIYGTGELEEFEEDDSSRTYYLARSRSLSESDEMDVPVWGTGELESSADLETAASMSQEEVDVPVWGTGELEESSADTEARAASFSNSDQALDEAPVWGTGELEEAEAGEAVSAAQSFASPNAAAFAKKLNEERLLNSEDPDTRAFAQDLQSILAGNKEHPSTTGGRSIIEEDEERGHDDAPSSTDNKAYPSSFSHQVFDQMGNDMSMARTFDLGSYDLSTQFDVFDRQIDREERSVEQRKHKALQKRAKARNTANEFAEDLAYINSSPPPPRVRAMDAPLTYDVTFDTPLIPQQTGMSCWAAGAAMLVAWRDQMSIDPSEIANATGAWAAYKHGLQPDDTSIFPVWGMVAEAPQSYTVEGCYNLLNTYGPLWVAGWAPGPHIRVVTGLRGDGTPDGTTVMINDPWEAGMTEFRLPNAGSQYARTYAQFVREMEALAVREADIPGAIYIAHLRGPRRR